LISVDTLRADRLGCYGNPLGLTPELDALAARSSVFEAAFAPTSFTRPSIASLLSGRYPEETGVHSNLAPFPEALPTLATQLRARGYRTGAVVSNAILASEAGLSRGFEHYDDRLEERERTRPQPERTAPRTTQDALAWLRDASGDSRPVFLWVHYQDPHGPYTPPEEYRALYREAERWPGDPALLPLGADNSGLRALPPYQAIDDEREPAFYRAGYDGEVRHSDAAIGELLRGVEAQIGSEQLVIAFTADHGEALGEGGMWFAHASSLVDPLVRVPLLFAIPGRAAERRSDTASLVDLVPTLLAQLGVPPPSELRGRDLLAPGAALAPSSAYFHALEPIPGQWVEHWGAARGSERFYRIEKEGQRRDYARRDGSEISPDTSEIEALRAGAESLRAAIRARAIPAAERAAPEPSADERLRLETLGYLDPAVN
jgi:arylsulfatase